MQFVHIIFLSLYALQVASSSPAESGEHATLEKRFSLHLSSSSFKNLFSHSSSSSSSTSSSSSSSEEEVKPKAATSKHTTVVHPTATVATVHVSTSIPIVQVAHTSVHVSVSKSVTVLSPTHSVSVASADKDQQLITASASEAAASKPKTATKTSSSNASKETEEAETKSEKKKSSMSKFGEAVKDLAIEGAAGIIVNSVIEAIDEHRSSSSDSSETESSVSLEVVAFPTTDASGNVETATITAPASDFSTGTDGQVYLKTEAVSDLIASASATSSAD